MKYVVDLKDNCNMIQQICVTENGNAYATYVESTYVHYLEELNSDYINEHFGELQDTAYKKGLHDGESKCRYCNEYQRGFEDGKAIHEKGCEGCKYGGTPQGDSQCFNCSNYYKNNWTAKDDKIVVGDGVNNIYSKEKGIVTQIIGDNQMYVLWQDGSSCICGVNKVTKIGRHFDIASILEDMKHD